MRVSLMPILTRLRRLWPGRAFVKYHPRYERAIRDCGLDSADAFLDLPGEVVSGHADRHVVEVRADEIKGYLKREHRVPWKTRLRNCLTGFGASSLAAREAKVLDELAQHGVPVPQWLAY